MLVVFKNTSNFAEKALFLLLGRLLLPVCGGGGGRRLGLIVTQAEDAGEYAAYTVALVAGAGRFGSDDESGGVSLRT